MTITKDDVAEFLQQEDWKKAFSSSALAAGKKLAHGRLVARANASILDTGDVEILAYVMEKTGHQHETIIALWQENGALMLDASCSCDQQINCIHCAAVLIELARGERLTKAFGDVVGEIPQQVITTPEAEKNEPTQHGVTFLLRIERRPQGEKLAYLPDIYAHAYAVYEGKFFPLEPAGNISPPRSRVAEMEALKTLYALDLLPGAEEPPYGLKKIAKPPHKGPLYAPNKEEWSHPEFYWQRFQHEALPALEKRGWTVQLSPHVGLKPLVFRTETWKAEIVEEGKGWFHLSAGFEIDGEEFELQPILASLLDNNFLELTEHMPQGQEFLIFLPDGRAMALPVGRFRQILKTLGEILEFKFTDGPIKLQKLDAALVVAEGAIEIEASEELEDVAEKIISLDTIEKVPVPDGLKAELREYQLDGFYWMQFLARSDFNGILADDMGLGKTLQTLTHILAEKVSGRSKGKPSLVIAPTSVVVNWQREAAKFAPELSVLILQGAQRKKQFHQIKNHDIVLSSFALIARDLDEFVKHDFHLFILDEAQHIKNPEAQVSKAVKQINTQHRLCLSGTPIENHLGELWSQFSFLMPGLLRSEQTFNETYRNTIEKDHDEAKRDALNARVGPLILRRTKHDVAKELPPKTEILHTIDLHTDQKDLYETVRSTMDKQVRQAIVARGGQAQMVFLEALLKLRQICCHPALIEQKDADNAAKESAKFDYLIELLETLRQEGHRVLLFSQFTSMLALIEAYLIEQEISYLILTGATKDRQSLVERFQGGEGEVFLISLKAGGTGLTLTGADTVIHYDPWWNPAAENQATDRAYRIGQDKAVMVHKLICTGTVEEKIQQMQARKNTLADNILDGSTQGITINAETMMEVLDFDGDE